MGSCWCLQGRSAALPQQPQAASVAQGVRPAPALVAGRSSSRSSGRSSGRAAGGSASLWAPVSGSGGAAGSQQQRSNALLLNSLGVPGASSSSGAGANVAPRQLEVHVDEEFGPTGELLCCSTATCHADVISVGCWFWCARPSCHKGRNQRALSQSPSLRGAWTVLVLAS